MLLTAPGRLSTGNPQGSQGSRLSAASDTFGGMKRSLIMLTAAALLLTGCASGVTLPEASGDTPEEQFVNTVRAKVPSMVGFSDEQALNVGTTVCHVFEIDDTDPEKSLYEAAEAQDYSRDDMDLIIAASKRYLCPEA
jgi:hypothetical protein